MILARLDWEGSPMSFSVRAVSFLSQFGQVAYGKEALAVFLNYIQNYIGDGDDKDFILDLFQIYPLLDVASTRSRSIDSWRGTDSIVDIQEKIIGEDTLHHIYILNLALEASKAVVRIRTPEGLGTGFMVAPDLLMTNNIIQNLFWLKLIAIIAQLTRASFKSCGCRLNTFDF
ncbi:MAG: hypothetical protein ACREPR_21815 [Brasilonema sp.]